MYCPMGCGETLGFMSLLCTSENCPRPTAAKDILSDRETEHIVRVEDYGWSIQHPLRERLAGELFNCPLSDHLAEYYPAMSQGKYRVRYDEVWKWETCGTI